MGAPAHYSTAAAQGKAHTAGDEGLKMVFVSLPQITDKTPSLSAVQPYRALVSQAAAVWPESCCTWPGITWSSRERSSPSCSQLCQSLAGLADTTPSPPCRWHSSAAEIPAPGHKHKQISALVAPGAPRFLQVTLLLREPPGLRPQGSPARAADTSAFSRAAQSGRSPAAAPPGLPSLPGAAHAFASLPAHPRARGCPRGPSTSGSAGPAARPHLRGLAGGLGQLLGELAQQAVGHGVLADVGLDGEHGHGGGSGGADGGSGGNCESGGGRMERGGGGGAFIPRGRAGLKGTAPGGAGRGKGETGLAPPAAALAAGYGLPAAAAFRAQLPPLSAVIRVLCYYY